MVACCSPGVTHIISEYETVEQSVKALCRESDDFTESTTVLKSAWLSECIKAGRLVNVRQEHRLPLGYTTSEVYKFNFVRRCCMYSVNQLIFSI